MKAAYYFTFGKGQDHPDTGKPMQGYWVEIVADSVKKAKNKMVSLFGKRWSHQFNETVFMSVRRYHPNGCYEFHEVD